MKDAYPELIESVQRVARVVKDEEHRYATTFQIAERMFHDEAKAADGRRSARRGGVQDVRYLRAALEEQEEMARELASRSTCGVPRGDGEAAHPRPRELERR